MTAWTDPREGRGSWEPGPAHDTPRSVLTAFLACLLGGVLLVGLVVAGRAGMCRLHADDPTPLSYCSETPR